MNLNDLNKSVSHPSDQEVNPMEPTKKPSQSPSPPEPDSPPPGTSETADADVTASGEPSRTAGDLPKTVVDLLSEANAAPEDGDASEGDGTDARSATASTDRPASAKADAPATADGGGKGATLSKPPSDVQETAPSDVVAGKADNGSGEDQPGPATSTRTKGATLSEPPASLQDEGDTDVEEDEEEDVRASASTDVEGDEAVIPADDGATEPVAEAEPVLGTDEPAFAESATDVEPETEPVADAGTDVGAETDVHDEPDADVEADVRAAPVAFTGPLAGVSEPTSAEADEEAEPVMPAETPSTTTSTATVAGALGVDRPPEEDAETVGDAPVVETFDDAGYEDEPASVTASGAATSEPVAAAPSASYAAGAAKADLVKRFLAKFLDGLIAAVLGFIIIAILPGATGFLVSGLVAGAYFLISDGLDVGFMRRRSLGKRLVGLDLHRLDAAPMDLGASAKRNWMFALGYLSNAFTYGGASFLSGLIGLAALGLVIYESYKIYSDPEGRRWGDDLAGTKVVEATA